MTQEELKEVFPAVGDRKKVTKYLAEQSKPPKFEEKAVPGPKSPASKPPQSYLLIGNTGAGKSYIVEDMTQIKNLAGDSGKSMTQDCNSYASPDGFIVVDTPGLADTEGKTLQHLNAITKFAQRTPNCVPVLVVKYDEKFTEQYRRCLEALSLALSLEANQYVLVINKLVENRGSSPEHKVQEILAEVGKEVGYLPINTITLKLGESFDPRRLTAIEFRSLSGVIIFDDLMRSLRDKHERLSLLRQRVENARNISILSGAGQMFKDVWLDGADVIGMGSGSIEENWRDGQHFKSFVKVAVLPFTALGTRLVGTLVIPGVALGESVADICTAYKGSLSADDRQFMEKNEAEVSKTWAKMSRVLQCFMSK